MTISTLLRFRTLALCILCLVFLLSVPAMAQPFGGWVLFEGYPTDHGYISVPHHPLLNFNGTGFTFEAWVSMDNTGDSCCHSIAGKNFINNWWVGTVWVGSNQVLRSILAGVDMQAGVIPNSTWTHIAVTYDGTRRIHYINGEKVGERVETLAAGGGYSDMRFGSDVSWLYTPHGSLNEMRLWNIARTQAQIRASLNQQMLNPLPGLLGAWSMSGTNAVAPYHGTIQGTGVYGWTFPVTLLGCNGSSSTTGLCLHNRFWV
ncbi:MAG: LamG domain-containing protein, partial [Acidobacteria bacterium]